MVLKDFEDRGMLFAWEREMPRQASPIHVRYLCIRVKALAKVCCCSESNIVSERVNMYIARGYSIYCKKACVVKRIRPCRVGKVLHQDICNFSDATIHSFHKLHWQCLKTF